MTSSLEAKIVVLGAQGVGKTSLLLRYIKNQFSPASTTSTVGASFLTKRVVDDESDTVVRLQIWDTAGQERFRSISRLYYRGANACILCYSITSLASFLEMGMWLTELRRNLPSDIIIHVVGTKADIVARDPSAREVPFERCIAYVADNLAPGMSSTPPPTATPGGATPGGVSEAGYRAFLANMANSGSGSGTAAVTGGAGVPPPTSKRSSGFWGQDVGWDCCHEISAESGEGVDEVFRVITRKLVEQGRKTREALALAVMTPGAGMTPGTEGIMDGDGGYFDRSNTGSFRVGRDRRSWLGFPAQGSGVEVDEPVVEGTYDSAAASKQKRRCCS